MTNTPKELLAINGLADLPDPIAVALWQAEDGRQDTLRAVKDISPAALDWDVPHYQNSIGTLLYHIGVIEADWLYVEVLQTDLSAVQQWLPYNDRDSSGRLTPVKNVSLTDLLAGLAGIRAELLKAFTSMSLEDFRRPRVLESYDVTPEWVLHHLLLHEAQHRGEIMMLRTLAEAQG